MKPQPTLNTPCYATGVCRGFFAGITWCGLLVAVMLLAGCGGGSADDAPAATQPVDCKARPELCK